MRELFEAAASELRDEVNVPLEHQEEPELLGMVRDLAHGGRCGLEFLIRLKVCLRREFIILTMYVLSSGIHPRERNAISGFEQYYSS